jgi:hypothetical protein
MSNNRSDSASLVKPGDQFVSGLRTLTVQPVDGWGIGRSGLVHVQCVVEAAGSTYEEYLTMERLRGMERAPV